MILNSFSNPYEGDLSALYSKLALRSFKSLDEKCSSRLDLEPLVSESNYAEIQADQELSERVGRLWQPILGHVRMAIAGQPSKGDEGWMRGNLELVLFLAGIRNFINIGIEAGHPIIISGVMLSSDFFGLNGEGNSLIVSGKDGSVLAVFDRVDAESANAFSWVPREASDEISIHGDLIISLIDQDWYNYWVRDSGVSDLPYILPRADDISGFKDAIKRYYDILKEYSPAYYDWSSLALKEIFPQKSCGATDSSSFLLCPGVIHLALPPNDPAGVGCLVHESSHQYYHLLMWNTPVVQSNAPDLYSILRDKNRPLSAIYLGHHALANVCLAYGELIINGYTESDLIPEYEHNLMRLKGLVDVVESADDVNFETVGHSIYQALNRRLQSENHL